MKEFMSLKFVTEGVTKLNDYVQAVDTYLSEANHMKGLSLALMLLALVLFLLLIIIIYIRSIIFLIKSNNPAKNMSGHELSKDTEDDEECLEDEEQRELERELQRELDIAIANQQAREKEVEEQQKNKKEKQLQGEDLVDKKEERLTYTKIERKNVGLDWQKGNIPPAGAEHFVTLNQSSLSYKQSKKELNRLIGLVIDMLGRGVDDLKIAQTINFKGQGINDENEILKTIDAIKQFINLCVSKSFVKLKNYQNLPNEEQALYHLSQGDASVALALIENLMDAELDRANSSRTEEKRQKIYNEISGQACCFGALAELNDIMLATTAYELAIELQSTNITAWSRLGDVYKRANSNSRAVWAYQNVIDMSDTEIDVSLVANANKHLSEKLYAEGNSLQAAKLYNAAKQYYDSLGINRRLDKQEIDIVNIIESNYKNSLSETIKKILAPSSQRA